MKADKSLQEVWDWKEKVYEEMKDVSVSEKIAAFSSFVLTSEASDRPSDLGSSTSHELEHLQLSAITLEAIREAVRFGRQKGREIIIDVH